MSILPLLLFSVSCNFDNFVIGISYGIKNISVNTKANIIIALPTLIGTYVSLNLGRAFFSLIPNNSANIISCGILIFIGLYMLLNVRRNAKNKVQNSGVNYDKDNNGKIDAKEAFLLGLFLAINNIGIGIGFSTSSNNILFTSLLTCFISAIGFNIGNNFGKKCFSRFVSSYAEYISGLLIILLGIIELFL